MVILDLRDFGLRIDGIIRNVVSAKKLGTKVVQQP